MTLQRASKAALASSGKAHELRNEVVEELMLVGEAKGAQSWMSSPRERAKTAGQRGKKAKESKEWATAGKKAIRLHAEKQACPRKRKSPALRMGLSWQHPEPDRKAFWDAEQLDGNAASRWRIASKPFGP